MNECGDINDMFILGALPDLKVTGEALQLLPINKPSTIYIHTDTTLPNVYVTVTCE